MLFEFGSWKLEGGGGKLEVGSRTRRRPIGQNYAAAKDAEVGRVESLCTVFFKIIRSTQKLTTGRSTMGLTRARIHYPMFDLPEADPPEADLLASGELDVH